MIAYLNGNIIKKTDKGIILSTGAIGYVVHLSKNLLALSEEKGDIELFIHQYQKEDGSDLYGFAAFSELNFFKQLIAINKIGPKVAMEILNIPLEKFENAIASGDTAFISKIPGIGKKTAQRLILELKGKLDLNENPKTPENEEQNDEVIDALEKLGYTRSEIRRVVKNAPKEISATEELITYFLKHNR